MKYRLKRTGRIRFNRFWRTKSIFWQDTGESLQYVKFGKLVIGNADSKCPIRIFNVRSYDRILNGRAWKNLHS